MSHRIAVCTYLEEEPDDNNLQRRHGDNHADLDHAEVDNSLLGAVHSAKVAVLTRAEVLLVTRNG